MYRLPAPCVPEAARRGPARTVAEEDLKAHSTTREDELETHGRGPECAIADAPQRTAHRAPPSTPTNAVSPSRPHSRYLTNQSATMYPPAQCRFIQVYMRRQPPRGKSPQRRVRYAAAHAAARPVCAEKEDLWARCQPDRAISTRAGREKGQGHTARGRAGRYMWV